jgi:octaprenyl-diphosphate synthase
VPSGEQWLCGDDCPDYPLRGQKGDTPAKPSLDPILALTAPGMNAVNAVILDRMQSEIPLIPALAGHLISGGASACAPC